MLFQDGDVQALINFWVRKKCVMCSNQCNSAHAMFWKTGPIRPVLLALLLMSTWKLHVTGRSLGWTVVSLLLAFLPELVDIWNTNRTQQWQRSDMNPGGNYDEKAATSLSSLPIDAKVRLTIPTMGCVACVNKVDTFHPTMHLGCQQYKRRKIMVVRRRGKRWCGRIDGIGQDERRNR